MGIFKKWGVVCASLALSVVFSVTAFGQSGNILFENRTQERLSRGVVYERNRMMTTNGMLDVHVILVDLNEQHLYIEPVTTSQNFGRRDTTSNMLADAGAIAGINADFFGMAGAYSVHFGPMARDGDVLALNTSTNYHYNEFATFFLDLQNNANFVYMQSDIRFYNNGVRNVTTINAFNNIGHNLYWPSIVDRRAMYNTVALDHRFPLLTKVVVENGLITFVSMPGENVDIPENGYVLILPERMREEYRPLFSVGQTARLEFTNNLNVDFSRIQAAVGGGGLILQGGEVVNDRGVAPSGRHPRTAVGVNHANRQLIMMTVDGRSHSIGATHNEMAEIMRRYGATDAMHLDGGGSTTMVTQLPGGRHLVANTPSDGGQRRVINALGVFNRAPVGAMQQLTLAMEESRGVVGVPLVGSAFGEDSFLNRIPLDPTIETVFFAQDPDAGFWQDGRYTPLRPGRHNLEVWYGDQRAVASIYAYSLAELQIRPASVSLLEGESTTISFSGVAVDGSPVPVPAVTGLTVSPAYLGVFNGNQFTSTRSGAGYISAMVGSVRAYAPISVGGFPQSLNLTTMPQSFLSYPAYVVGNVRPGVVGGRNVTQMEYLFVQSPSTQAAYLTFDPAVEIPRNPIALRLQVYGDGSGHWLRGRVIDANGNNHIIDFTQSADFVGWETLTARMPNAPAPFTIDRIYMVTLGSYEVSHHTIGFYGLEALYAPDNQVQIPQGTVFHDRLRADSAFNGVPGGGSYQFTIPASGSGTGYSSMAWSDFAVITMTAQGGGISVADRSQWSRFMADIRAINPGNVVILMDTNPLNFSQRMEFELFHGAMEELRAEGRLVFVVSATGTPGTEATLTMRDGIRYINVSEPDAGIATIRFFTDGDQIWWAE